MHIGFVIYSLFLKKKKETDAMTAIHHIKYVLKCKFVSLGMVKPFIKKHIKHTIAVCEWFCLWCYRSCLVYSLIKVSNTDTQKWIDVVKSFITI